MCPRPNTLQSSLGYHIYRLNAHMRDRFAHALNDHGVTPSEWSVLAAIGRGGCTTAAEICQATGRDKAGVARTLAALVASELVVRSPGGDARTKPLALSERALALLPSLEACSRQVNRSVLAHLDAEDRDTLARLLQHLTASLDSDR